MSHSHTALGVWQPRHTLTLLRRGGPESEVITTPPLRRLLLLLLHQVGMGLSHCTSCFGASKGGGCVSGGTPDAIVPRGKCPGDLTPETA